MITESLSDIRDRIHKKSGEYFTFAYGRRDQASWRMFYGATDALLDASMAARAFSKAVRSDPAIDLLICYGFLQAIYIQQDAVWTLSRAVEIKWRPNDNSKLRLIRDMRDRLTGHPAVAGENSKPKRLSSAIISYDKVSKRSPDGAERNPGRHRRLAAIPDYAPLHPGYGADTRYAFFASVPPSS